MLRAYLNDAKRCYLHGHRIVTTQCARCRTPYCNECLTERTEGVFGRLVQQDERHPEPLFCERCIEELEAIEAQEAWRHRPLWQRLIPSRAQINRVAIYAAVILVILVPIAIAARSAANTPISPEELARVKVGLVGGFQTAEGTNFLSQVYGGRYVRASSPAQPDHDPARLIDTWTTPDIPGWRTRDATFPQEVVFVLPALLRVDKVILRPHPNEPPETWVKDFEVLASSQSATEGFASVVRGSLTVDEARKALDPDAADQPRFTFPEVTARWIMLRVLSNQGSRDYTSLAEFEVYWVRQ